MTAVDMVNRLTAARYGALFATVFAILVVKWMVGLGESVHGPRHPEGGRLVLQ